MDKSFYKKEVASLQSLFDKFSSIQFTFDQDKSSQSNSINNHRGLSDEKLSDRQSKDSLIVVIVLFLLIIGMVGFLTVWLAN